MIYRTIPLTHGNDEKANLRITCHDYSPEMYVQERPFMMVIPGGGYEYVSDREADPIANAFIAAGYHVGILTYSTAPHTFPTPYFQAFEALKYVIDNASELHIDTDNLAVCGFSAGGHLAGLVGTGLNDPLVLKEFNVPEGFFKLKGMILSYAVIDGGEFAHRGSFDNLLGKDKDDPEVIKKMSIQNRVTEKTPKAFLWSTFEDGSVPCENTLMMADALRKHKVPFELHIFPVGGHGLALSTFLTQAKDRGGCEPYCAKWVGLAIEWLNMIFEWK